MNKELNEIILGLIVLGKYWKPGADYLVIEGENLVFYHNADNMDYKDTEMLRLHGWQYKEGRQGVCFWEYFVGCTNAS
jgi:hypothetical protein